MQALISLKKQFQQSNRDGTCLEVIKDKIRDEDVETVSLSLSLSLSEGLQDN